MKEKKFLFKDSTRAVRFQSEMESKKQELQALVDEFNKIGYSPILDGIEIQEMLSAPDSFAYHKATGGGLKIRGAHDSHLDVDHSLAMGLIKYKAGTEPFVAKIKGLVKRNWYQRGSLLLNVTEITKFFTIEEGKVAFTSFAKNQIQEAGKLYLHTEKGKRIWRLIELINEEIQDPELLQHLGLRYSNNQGKIEGKIPAENLFFKLGEMVTSFQVGAAPIIKYDDTTFPRVSFDR